MPLYNPPAEGVSDVDVVHNTGDETIAGVKTFSSDPLIPDEAYGAGWNGSLEPPTKNAVYDKVETLGGITNSAPAGTIPVTADGDGNLEASRVTDDGTTINLNSGDVGIVRLGDTASVGVGTILSVSDGNAEIILDVPFRDQKIVIGANSQIGVFAPSSEIVIGDVDGEANGTFIQVDDGSNYIDIDPGVGGEVHIGTNPNQIRVDVSGRAIHLDASDGGANVTNLTVDGNGQSIALTTPIIKANATVTPAATTGAQEINKSAGSVNFGIGATSLVVTNSTVTADSIILATVATDDATGRLISVVAGSGSFTINVVAPAAEMRVNFWVITPQ